MAGFFQYSFKETCAGSLEADVQAHVAVTLFSTRPAKVLNICGFVPGGRDTSAEKHREGGNSRKRNTGSHRESPSGGLRTKTESVGPLGLKKQT
jgi:hypothetical protein